MPTQIAEDVSHAWYAEAEAPLPPLLGSTVPLADKETAYTWCKAPRLGGEVVETGALARQVVAGQPLLRDLVARDGGSVESRVVARLLEVARLLPAMEAWADRLRPGEPFSVAGELPAEGEGIGLVEAARGSLGHWLTIRRGRIAQLPDHRSHHLELLAARQSRPPRRAGAGPGRRAGRRGRHRAGGGAARRPFVRSLHGLHGALMSRPDQTRRYRATGRGGAGRGQRGRVARRHPEDGRGL